MQSWLERLVLEKATRLEGIKQEKEKHQVFEAENWRAFRCLFPVQTASYDVFPSAVPFIFIFNYFILPIFPNSSGRFVLTTTL